MEPIILASGSLRRQEFFRLLGLPFSVMVPPLEERLDPALPPRKVAEDLATRKITTILNLIGGQTPSWIAGADTLITLGGRILGKPEDREGAKGMLLSLQGREHEVVTAMALYNGRENRMDCRSVATTVVFSPMGDAEIEWYLDTGEWQGVAGGYRIQGRASCFIEEIRGSYTSVVGLPLREFYVMLRENGYPYGK